MNALARCVINHLPLEQMRVRYIAKLNTYGQMVGTLYPSIVYAELMAMREDYFEAGGKNDDLPYTPPPNGFGRAPFVWIRK